MASGNLGDLWFQLGIKDNSHKALNSMLKDVQRLEGMINSLNLSINKEQDPKKKKEMKEQLSNALNYLHLLQKVNIELNKISGIKNVNAGINTGELDRAKKALMDFRNELINLQAGKTASGVDNAFMSAYNAKFRNLITDVRQIEKAFDKENTLSASKNNAARLNRELETTKNKLAEIQSLQSRGIRNRIDTTALLSGGNTLRGVKRRMETMLADDNLLANGAKVKSLLSDIAFAYTKATGKVQEYKRTASETASVDSAFSKQKLAVEQINTILGNIDKLKGKSLEIGTDTSKLTAVRGEIERIKTTIDSFSGKQLLNKGFGDALNELQLWKERVNRTLKDQSGANQSAKATDRNLETMEARYRRLQELISEVNRKIRELNDSAKRGFKVGADTSRVGSAISRLFEMRDKFNNADIGSKNAVAELVSEYKILKNEIGNAKSEQDKLNNAITRANKKQDRKNERQEARDNKQRLSEIKAAEARYDSLGNKVRALRREFSRGISLGADVSKAEAEIHRLIDIMRYLRQMRTWLVEGQNVVGRIGSIGTGHDATQAGRALQDQRAINAAQEKANREKEKSIDLERAHQQEVAKTAAKVRGDLAKAFEQAKNHSLGMNSTLQDLKSLFLQGGLIYGAQQFAMSIIQAGGEIEKQHIALQSIIGDVQNANVLFNQTKELALNSPFTFSELNKDVKQLAAYGVEYDELYDTTKRLADMASGLGVSFERIALAFGQVRSRGWLDGKELRQISYAGIPILQKLSEYYTKKEGQKVSTSEVKSRISNRGVDFEDVKNVFWEMTDAGGQFYNMQQVLSETLLGRYNKLKDAWEIMLSEFASGNNLVGSFFKTALDGATALVQALHTLALPVGAVVAGYAMRRALMGNTASSLLSIKGGLAKSALEKQLRGENLTPIERNILSTKNKITGADLRSLMISKQLNQSELARLRIAGKITQQQYLTYSALLKQQTGMNTFGMRARHQLARLRMMAGMMANPMGAMRNMWSSFTTSALASFRVIRMGAKALVASMWSAIGGLPGLIISGVTFGISYLISKSQELKQDMQQTMDEMKDRIKQIDDFMRDNNVDKIVRGDNEKEIDNAIESYKDKIREIAPESANAFEMKASEIESHKERLKYLEEQLELLKEANKVAQEKSENTDLYEDLRDKTESAVKAAETLVKRSSIFGKGGVNETEMGLYEDAEKEFDKFIGQLAARYKKEFPNIVNSMQEQQAMQTMLKNFLALKGASEEATVQIRSALNRALGLEDKDMEQAFASKLMNMVDSAFPEIADRIRGHKELDEESKRKVENLMRGAVSELSIAYPKWETELQRLLAESSFEAKIQLVYDTGMIDNFDPFTGRIYNNVLGSNITQWKENAEKFQELKPLLKGVNDMYTARNKAKTELEKRYNIWKAEEDAKKKGKGDEATRLAVKKKYEDLKKAAYLGLGYDYVPEDKKSVKDDKEDKKLESLRQQFEDFKAARQWYQKYIGIGNTQSEAIGKVKSLFPNLDWKKIDLSKYMESLEAMMPGRGFWNTTDRKKFHTQVNREKAEWQYSEIDKVEWERVSSNFKEALGKGVKQANLQKELYEKTGSLDFAKLAFQDGAVWDKQTRKMAEDFKKNFGHDVNLGMTEADAKVLYKDTPLALEAWQKITTLVKDNYVKSLQQAADIIAQTASTQEKIAAIYAKYETPIAQAEEAGNYGLASRYTRQRDKEVNSAKTEAFNKSSDYITFFGAVSQLGMDRASEIASQIRENINQALADGTIDAREYGKQIQQLDEQLNKLSSGKKNFFNSGLSGVAEQRVKNANEKITAGAALKQEGERMQQEANTELIEAFSNLDFDAVDEIVAKMLEGNEKEEKGDAKLKQGQKEAKAANEFKESMANVSAAASKINENIQSIVATFNDIKDTASALGVDTENDGWQDATAFFNSLGGVSSSISNMVTSAMSGNVGGVLQGFVGIFTSPFKAFAAAHDAKLERQIKLAERNITELERLRNDVKTAIENTLGGVYSYKMDADTRKRLGNVTNSYEKAARGESKKSQYSSDTYTTAKKSLSDPGNAYLAEQASLMAQKDEMQRQLNAEEGKKKKDKDKIADYKQQIKEMETTINNFAKDFLKDIYGVDMKAWASQLTDAVVSAWSKGEDSIDAYKKKAKEMVKDLTKNIVSQKVMEVALQEPLDNLTEIIKQKGKLEPEDVVKVADDLYNGTNNAAENITAILERLKNMGLDFSENGDGSVTNGIKNITEETADILASYVNAIRLDVSVNRAQVKDIGELLKMRLPEMGQIQKAQLGQLTQIVMLAEARNEKLDRMMDWMNAVSTSGRKKLYIS
nr:MAG TPA: AAA domain protein [Caudoviricetes sp.]